MHRLRHDTYHGGCPSPILVTSLWNNRLQKKEEKLKVKLLYLLVCSTPIVLNSVAMVTGSKCLRIWSKREINITLGTEQCSPFEYLHKCHRHRILYMCFDMWRQTLTVSFKLTASYTRTHTHTPACTVIHPHTPPTRTDPQISPPPTFSRWVQEALTVDWSCLPSRANPWVAGDSPALVAPFPLRDSDLLDVRLKTRSFPLCPFLINYLRGAANPSPPQQLVLINLTDNR